jgi:hypothetical protein
MTSVSAETIRCPHCAETLSSTAHSCNRCGSSVNGAPAKSRAIASEPKWVRHWQKWVARAQRGLSLAKKYLLDEPNQQWWDLTAMLGGGVLGMLWMIYSQIRQSEGSFTTAIMIVLMPVVITKARKQLDEWLRPLQKYRRRLPQWALITAGVLAPFGITTILLQFGVRLLGISDQRCIQAAMLIGTSVAYALLREPDETNEEVVDKSKTGQPPLLKSIIDSLGSLLGRRQP